MDNKLVEIELRVISKKERKKVGSKLKCSAGKENMLLKISIQNR